MRKRKLPAKIDAYSALLAEVKSRIQHAQTRAVLAVNAELVGLYWDIGCELVVRQAEEGWGAGVIPRLALDLRNDLPEVKGFSERNIDSMVRFHKAYPNPAAISQQPVAKLATSELSRPAASKTHESLLWQVPWGHHIMLLQKIPDLATRIWYMRETLAHGWSRSILSLQIAGGAHARRGQAVTNFVAALPPPQSDLAQQTLKDPYIFDFLTLTEPFQERELETSLVRHLEKFLLELGQGFAFVGRQHRLEVGGEDFHLDLLFYHLRLRAFVVIELKKGRFKPEYAGKLNFYCNVVNDTLKHPSDAPTIGLLLCQAKDNLLAEYSFAGIDKPIGISTYELTRALPPGLRSALPTVEEIEAELTEAPSQEAAAKPKSRKRGGKK